ncbi:MAG: hypothetical protein DRI44_09155 [Chlamydiae bacterium]|nr:MAG: hypothetical protein DRI44_09155 [Chlamydiota bacterium]
MDIGWIGNALFLAGAILIARGNVKAGLACNFLANGAYLYQSQLMNNVPLFVLSFVLMGVNFVGFIRWNKWSKNYDRRH